MKKKIHLQKELNPLCLARQIDLCDIDDTRLQTLFTLKEDGFCTAYIHF